jgi:hypothetical protein
MITVVNLKYKHYTLRNITMHFIISLRKINSNCKISRILNATVGEAESQQETQD